MGEGWGRESERFQPFEEAEHQIHRFVDAVGIEIRPGILPARLHK